MTSRASSFPILLFGWFVNVTGPLWLTKTFTLMSKHDSYQNASEMSSWNGRQILQRYKHCYSWLWPHQRPCYFQSLVVIRRTINIYLIDLICRTVAYCHQHIFCHSGEWMEKRLQQRFVDEHDLAYFSPLNAPLAADTTIKKSNLYYLHLFVHPKLTQRYLRKNNHLYLRWKRIAAEKPVQKSKLGYQTNSTVRPNTKLQDFVCDRLRCFTKPIEVAPKVVSRIQWTKWVKTKLGLYYGQQQAYGKNLSEDKPRYSKELNTN